MNRKAPRKITEKYLENAALYYLERYATSAANLRRVLLRKIERSCRHHGDDPTLFHSAVDKLITRYTTSGLLDDRMYARGRVASLRRKGLGRQAIFARLQTKGLESATIDQALQEIDADQGDAEFEAAKAFCQRKRLAGRDLKKSLAALARAGFNYETAKRALESMDNDETTVLDFNENDLAD